MRCSHLQAPGSGAESMSAMAQAQPMPETGITKQSRSLIMGVHSYYVGVCSMPHTGIYVQRVSVPALVVLLVSAIEGGSEVEVQCVSVCCLLVVAVGVVVALVVECAVEQY